jgi:hypothetical protein
VRDHGPVFSDKLTARTMTNAVVARKQGDEFQGRMFWLYAALLLDPRGAVARVAYETGPKAFDDVLIEYAPGQGPQDHSGHLVARDHLQCKWHVRPDEFGYADLADPSFSGAPTSSAMPILPIPASRAPRRFLSFNGPVMHNDNMRPMARAGASSSSRTGGSDVTIRCFGLF